MSGDPRPVNSKVAWSARLGEAFIHALAKTWRYRIVNPRLYEQERFAGRPVIMVLWHGEMLPLMYWHRNRKIAVLVSEHGDGEIIARILDGLGFRLVRGSSSRNAARALIALDRELKAGFDVGITPDGPRGPRHSVAPGALLASHRAGVAILPLAAHVSASWRLRTWDGFIIPKPFARITIAYGDPKVIVAPNAREAGEMTSVLAEAMVQAQHRAGG